MRIVAGRHRGRRIAAPAGLEVRPTADRTREALFNILEHGLAKADGTSPLLGARVLDAFAGSGALGLEALSRGATHATFMDDHAAARSAIRANAEALGERAHVAVLPADAAAPPPVGAPCDIAFLDPPYRSGLGPQALGALAARGWLVDGAICSIEMAAGDRFAPPAGFIVLDERRYGKAKLILLRYDAPKSPSR
ncbi:MAG: 16S rRNA (guanine(966)-N(2))-methyltransferase RsmD [Dongiaceae bacterium]